MTKQRIDKTMNPNISEPPRWCENDGNTYWEIDDTGMYLQVETGKTGYLGCSDTCKCRTAPSTIEYV